MMLINTTGSSLILTLLLLPVSSSASLQDAFVQRFLQPNQKGPDFVNDLFHCLGFVQEDDDTVNCDMVTSLWNVSSLDPNAMPNSCVGVNITEDFLTVTNDDFVEPCIWWHLLYGNLSEFSPSAMPSSMPSPVPSQLQSNAPSPLPSYSPFPSFSIAPTSQPTLTPSAPPPTSPPSKNPSSAPSYNLAKKPSRDLSSFVLTLTLPITRNRRRVASRYVVTYSDELIQLTQKHLRNYLQDSLGISIASVSLKTVASEYSTSSLVADLEGQVYFIEDSILPTQPTLDFLVKQAFYGTALDEFLRLLQDEAKSSLLQNTVYAQVSVEGDETTTSQAPKQANFFGNFQWTTPWIIIVTAGGLAVIAIFILGLVWYKTKSRRQASSSLGQDDLLVKQNSGETPTTHPDQPEMFEDDELESELGSDGTSVYSYKQQDDASISLAPSFLHAITERSALGAFYAGGSDDDSLQTPSLLWNQPGVAEQPGSDQPRPKSVILLPSEDQKTKSTFTISALKQHDQQPESEDENASYAQSWTYEGASALGDESVAGDSAPVMYLTDDDEGPQNEFSHLWDDEEKKEDITSFPDGDISFEEDVYSNP